MLAPGSGLVGHWLSQGSYSLSALTADIRVRATSTLPNHTADAERADGVIHKSWTSEDSQVFVFLFPKGCLLIIVHGIPSLFVIVFLIQFIPVVINSDGKLKPTTNKNI